MYNKEIKKFKPKLFKCLWKYTYFIIKYFWKFKSILIKLYILFKYKLVKFYRLFKYYFIKFLLESKYNLIQFSIIYLKITYRYKSIKKRLYRKDLIIRLRLKNIKKNINPRYDKFWEITIKNIKSMYYTLIIFLIRQAEAVFEKGIPNIIVVLYILKNYLIFYFFIIKYWIIKVSRKYIIIRIIIRMYREYISIKWDNKLLVIYIALFIDLCLLEIMLNPFLKKNKIYILFFFEITFKLVIWFFIIFYPILITIVLDYSMFLEFIPMSEPDPWWLSYEPKPKPEPKPWFRVSSGIKCFLQLIEKSIIYIIVKFFLKKDYTLIL